MNNAELSNNEISIAIGNLRGAEEMLINLSAKSVTAVFQNHTIYDYSPVNNDSLNLKLRDEYEVYVNYEVCQVGIDDGGCDCAYGFNDKSQINRAVCLCILESVQ